MNINEIKSPNGVSVKDIKEVKWFEVRYGNHSGISAAYNVRNFCITLASEYEKLQQETSNKIAEKDATIKTLVGDSSELEQFIRKTCKPFYDAEKYDSSDGVISPETVIEETIKTMQSKIAELESTLKQQSETPWPADPHRPVEGVEVFDMNDFHAKTNYGIKLYRVDGIEYFALNNHGHVISCTGNCISAWNVPVTKHNPNHTREIIERERDRIREERKAKEQPVIQPIPAGVKLWQTQYYVSSVIVEEVFFTVDSDYKPSTTNGWWVDLGGKASHVVSDEFPLVEITNRWPELTQEQRQAIIDHVGKVRAVKDSAPQPIELKPWCFIRSKAFREGMLFRLIDKASFGGWIIQMLDGDFNSLHFHPGDFPADLEVQINGHWHSVATGKKVEE